MKCPGCHEDKMVSVSAKCSDLCFVQYPDGTEHDGYVPENLPEIRGLGGDYVEFNYCQNCLSIIK